MSARELSRVEVLSRVKAGTLSLRSAATLLAVSYRQAKRLARRYRAEGAKGLKHRSAGHASNHARPTAERERALALVREKYSGPADLRFGPTLAAEHLASEDGITVHHDTLRRWMWTAGLWSRIRRHAPHRQRRERKAHFGELVQLDGSFHLWYEARAPRGCLMNLVDDATGRTLARLGGEETIWAAADVLRRWIETYGVPLALYTDWKNVYVRVPNAEEQGTGAVPLTQFGRMCASLGIQIIAASSPQAKAGRTESPDSSGSSREDTAPVGDRGRDRGECVPGDDVSARAQRPLRAGPCVDRRLSSTDAESRYARSRAPTRGDARAVQRLGGQLRHTMFSSGAAEPPGAGAEHGAGARERQRRD
jgi:transposase